MIFIRVQDDAEERAMRKPLRKLDAVKKELYTRIRSQVADRLGLQDREIKKSEATFRRLFGRRWKRCQTNDLQKRIQNSDLIFWGDFHGVRQFQKNLLRWLRKQDVSKRPIVLALECLPSRNQKTVDEYLRGFISEEEFLRKTKWVQVWGFPWSHYKPLFDWVREHKQKIRVINGPRQNSTSSQRERWGLQQVLEIQEESPDSQIFVLYGEYHLLPRGFPSLLKKKRSGTAARVLFVFQNSDSLYFQKPPARQNPEGEVFRAGDSYFCLQNVSPWVKWQNYNLFLESSHEADLDDDFDLTEHVLSLSQFLSQTLRLPLDPNHLAVYTSGDRALWDQLKKMPESEFLLFEDQIEEGMSFVYPAGGWAFLGRITANETASLAMQSLIFQFNPQLNWKTATQQAWLAHWQLMIWIHSFSYFGSKVVNPHRKSPSLSDLQKKSRTLTARPVERQAARLAVYYTLHQSLGGENNFRESYLSDSTRCQAIRWVSSLLGEKLYNAYNQGALTPETLKGFLQKNPANENFHIVIQDLYETVEGF